MANGVHSFTVDDYAAAKTKRMPFSNSWKVKILNVEQFASIGMKRREGHNEMYRNRYTFFFPINIKSLGSYTENCCLQRGDLNDQERG